MNCMQHSLLQWLRLPTFRIWYNSNHAVIIEPTIDLRDKGYIPVEEFGFIYFNSAFKLDDISKRILTNYLQSLKEVPASCDKKQPQCTT